MTIKFLRSFAEISFDLFSRADSPIARLYSTSTMEHHHFDQSVMILNSEVRRVFNNNHHHGKVSFSQTRLHYIKYPYLYEVIEKINNDERFCSFYKTAVSKLYVN